MMKALPKVIFFGSDAICLPFLNFLIKEGAAFGTLAAVVSQPDRRRGRGKKEQANPVAAWASENGIALFQPEKPDRQLAASLNEINPVIGFVMAYGHFLPNYLRDLPDHGLVNFHGSILPAYRGASPVETALAEGLSSTGVSLMQIVRAMDAGGVADIEEVAISDVDTAVSLRLKIGQAVVPLMSRNFNDCLSGNLSYKPQDSNQASYCRKITKEDGAIDFTLPAAQIASRIRAFTPWPGGYFDYNDERLKVGRCGCVEVNTGHPPATVLGLDEKSCLRIACEKSVLLVYELQRPGGRMLPVSDFLRGFDLPVGTRLGSVPARALVL